MAKLVISKPTRYMVEPPQPAALVQFKPKLCSLILSSQLLRAPRANECGEKGATIWTNMDKPNKQNKPNTERSQECSDALICFAVFGRQKVENSCPARMETNKDDQGFGRKTNEILHLWATWFSRTEPQLKESLDRLNRMFLTLGTWNPNFKKKPNLVTIQLSLVKSSSKRLQEVKQQLFGRFQLWMWGKEEDVRKYALGILKLRPEEFEEYKRQHQVIKAKHDFIWSRI